MIHWWTEISIVIKKLNRTLLFHPCFVFRNEDMMTMERPVDRAGARVLGQVRLTDRSLGVGDHMKQREDCSAGQQVHWRRLLIRI